MVTITAHSHIMLKFPIFSKRLRIRHYAVWFVSDPVVNGKK